jgi:hypothetical protein
MVDNYKVLEACIGALRQAAVLADMQSCLLPEELTKLQLEEPAVLGHVLRIPNFYAGRKEINDPLSRPTTGNRQHGNSNTNTGTPDLRQRNRTVNAAVPCSSSCVPVLHVASFPGSAHQSSGDLAARCSNSCIVHSLCSAPTPVTTRIPTLRARRSRNQIQCFHRIRRAPRQLPEE